MSITEPTVARPLDSRTQARTSPALLVGAGLVALVLTACSGSKKSGSVPGSVPGALSAAEANAELIAERSQLPPLPAGASWPNKLLTAVEPDGTPDTYGPTFGTQIADGQWRCIWLKQVLASPAGSDRYKADLAELGKYKSSYLYRHDPDERKGFDKAYSAAQLGDTSDFARDYRANCAE